MTALHWIMLLAALAFTLLGCSKADRETVGQSLLAWVLIGVVCVIAGYHLIF
jgi:hypothetical protein